MKILRFIIGIANLDKLLTEKYNANKSQCN